MKKFTAILLAVFITVTATVVPVGAYIDFDYVIDFPLEFGTRNKTIKLEGGFYKIELPENGRIGMIANNKTGSSAWIFYDSNFRECGSNILWNGERSSVTSNDYMKKGTYYLEINSYNDTDEYFINKFDLDTTKPDKIDWLINLKVGEKLSLSAIAAYSQFDNGSIKYKTNKKNVAKVSKSGKITAVAKGTATITLTSESGDLEQIIKIRVK